tara:strand:+ start:50571 stop:51782 length:1212 start_codon:yes stop_codon:yes gene_type:complete
MLLQKSLKTTLFSLALAAVCLSSYAEAPTSTNQAPINHVMSELGQTIDLLSSEIFSQSNEAPEKTEDFKKQIDRLAELFKASKSHISKRSIAYNISYDLMLQQIDDIKIVVDRGDIALAKGMLKSVPYLCVGCHTQDTQQNKIFSNVDRVKFENDYQYAEYLYVTRNYDESVKYYLSYLNTLKPSSEEFTQTALKKILVIYSQIKKQPEEAILKLQPFTQKVEINKSTRKDIGEWIEGLKELKTSSVLDEKQYKERQAYVEYYLNQLANHDVNYFATEKDKVFYITLRGLLYEYLNAEPPQNDVPVILYWLAVCDRTLEYSFFDDLADIYLKECILTYSRHPYAKKCFQEYEAFMRFAYTGSGGTHLPSDIKQEIEILQNVIRRSAPKSKNRDNAVVEQPIIN